MADLSHLLHELVMAMDAQGERKLAPFGLSMRRFVTLTIVGEHPGVMARHLAAAVGVTEAGMSGIIRDLAEAGLVRAESVPGAGRAKPITLTSVGERRLAAATAALGGSFDDVVRAAGEDPDDLSRSLGRIVAQLEADPAD
ncbi:MAG: MarR family transcriptional regulator [Actinobacteria bacterium]|nr:MarR family transcriptional regulator [Actinomycetota bacterium]